VEQTEKDHQFESALSKVIAILKDIDAKNRLTSTDDDEENTDEDIDEDDSCFGSHDYEHVDNLETIESLARGESHTTQSPNWIVQHLC
jgi:hypothetical protein